MMSFHFLTVAIFFIFFAHAAYAQDSFESVYKDQSNGLLWTGVMGPGVANGCFWNGVNESKCTYVTKPDGSLEIDPKDSGAAYICDHYGAGSRLPTKAEYESLMKQFDHTVSGGKVELTPNGRSDMNEIFSDMDYSFWTSSADAIEPRYMVYVFRGAQGVIELVSRQGMSPFHKVRCVKVSQ